jgi:uncharacterized SAM-binding protein YcdF (DUF218 family)
MIRFILKSFIATLLMLGMVWCYGLHRFLETISYYPISNDETDAIVIFTGGRGRIEQGFELLKIYPNTPILVSGVWRELRNLPLTKTLEQDIDITLGHDAQNTLGNAQETKKWVQSRGIKSIRLVTSHYHMPRSLLVLHRTMPDLVIIPHPIISDHFQTESWWNNRKLYKMIVGEYNKFLLISVREFLEL